MEIYDQKTFKKVDQLELDFNRNIVDKVDARSLRSGQVMEILQVELCADESTLAVLVGESLKEKNQNLNYFLFVFSRRENGKWR